VRAPQDEVLDPHGEERGTPRVSNHEAPVCDHIRPDDGCLKFESICHHPPPGPAFGRPDDRLKRVIQYSRDISSESKGRGVLDTPHSRGMTAVSGVCSASFPWLFEI
jgi:hypothetical protein